MSESPTPQRSPYKIDTGPIPLDVLAVNPDGKGECWYRIPSWRVYFDCEALKGVDVRLHRAVASHAVWTLTEATTGSKMFGDLPHDQYIGDEGSMLAEFAAGVMLKLTPEKVASSIAKARERLTKHTPSPFVSSEKEEIVRLRASLERALDFADQMPADEYNSAVELLRSAG